MHEFKWGGKLAVKTTRYLIDHVGRVKYCKEPELSAYLFLCDIGTRHLYDSAPGAFNKAVGRLPACVGCNDAEVVGSNPVESGATNELGVKVRVKLARDSSCVGAKGFKSCDDAGGGGLHAVQPTVACSNVNKDQCVAIATKRQAVTKDNVHVDLVQIATALAQWLACGRIHAGRKKNKSGRKLSRVDELGIRRRHSKVLLVPEAVVTKYIVKLESVKDTSFFQAAPVLQRRTAGRSVGSRGRRLSKVG